jgi:hypothetical protein
MKELLIIDCAAPIKYGVILHAEADGRERKTTLYQWSFIKKDGSEVELERDFDRESLYLSKRDLSRLYEKGVDAITSRISTRYGTQSVYVNMQLSDSLPGLLKQNDFEDIKTDQRAVSAIERTKRL